MTTKVEQFISSTENVSLDYRQFNIPVYLRSSHTLMSLLLILTDLISLLLAGLLANGIRAIFVGGFSMDIFLEILPFVFLSQMMFASSRLYPAMGTSPVNELRRLTSSTTSVFLFLAAMTFWLGNAENFSRINLALMWIFSLVLVPLGRALLRDISGRINFYGEPIVVIGFGERGKETVKYLQENLALGLRPVMIIDGCDDKGETSIDGIPIIHLDDPVKISALSQQLGVDTAIILSAELPNGTLEIVEKISLGIFKRLILIPDREQIGGSGIRKYDLGMNFGLEVKRNLYNKSEMMLKRMIDIALVLSGGLFVLPFILLIALIVKLDSKGSVFYGATRIGKDKRKFKAWKYRTMVPNADQLLAEYLEKDSELRKEWETTYKLRNDPRITRVGRFLRRLSLDELPQLWNVLLGEMSLVGPRPILTDEVNSYGDLLDEYASVRPGITGLWQVSGRNDSGYEYRLRLTKYYISNWSIWMDIYILARTASVVLQRKGAY